jgi:hypothetical protein
VSKGLPFDVENGAVSLCDAPGQLQSDRKNLQRSRPVDLPRRGEPSVERDPTSESFWTSRLSDPRRAAMLYSSMSVRGGALCVSSTNGINILQERIKSWRITLAIAVVESSMINNLSSGRKYLQTVRHEPRGSTHGL